MDNKNQMSTEALILKNTEEYRNRQFFKVETYTDGDLTQIDVMSPVDINGSGKTTIDKDAEKIFLGKTQIEVNGRVMPYSFMIAKALNLKQAIDNFDISLDAALQHTKEKIEEFQKEAGQSIITPKAPNGIIVP